MDPANFFAASGVVIVAGKGGVGKTTMTAALAQAASLQGLSALIVEIEGKAGLARLFGVDDLDYEEQVLVAGDEAAGVGEVRARSLTADVALLEYLNAHAMGRVAKRLVSSGVLDVLATAVPGIKDILLLGKVKQLEQDATADLIVLDAPASGHAITFLRAARALLDAVRVGPINAQAQEVMELLTDADRCRVVLTTLPEETPINELIETAHRLGEDVGVALGPVLVNGLYEPVPGLQRSAAEAADETEAVVSNEEADVLDAAADFRGHRMALQADQVDRLAEALPLPQIRLPFVFTADLSPDDLDALALHLVEQVEGLPDAVEAVG
jgi:arsenite-transporting ATPase